MSASVQKGVMKHPISAMKEFVLDSFAQDTSTAVGVTHGIFYQGFGFRINLGFEGLKP